MILVSGILFKSPKEWENLYENPIFYLFFNFGRRKKTKSGNNKNLGLIYCQNKESMSHKSTHTHTHKVELATYDDIKELLFLPVLIVLCLC